MATNGSGGGKEVTSEAFLSNPRERKERAIAKIRNRSSHTTQCVLPAAMSSATTPDEERGRDRGHGVNQWRGFALQVQVAGGDGFTRDVRNRRRRGGDGGRQDPFD